MEVESILRCLKSELLVIDNMSSVLMSGSLCVCQASCGSIMRMQAKLDCSKPSASEAAARIFAAALSL